MGRGKCIKVMFIAFLVVGLSVIVDAANNHVVGGSQGWDFSISYADWANKETSFAAGDTLVFNYANGAHNVVRVNLDGYRSCKASTADLAKAMTTGTDQVKLKRGANYFICSYGGHCSAGMKIRVMAK